MMKTVYQLALNKYGFEGCKWGFVEEMGEVMQSFSHERRGRILKEDVVKELVDVQITLNIVRLIYITIEEWQKKVEVGEKKLIQKIINDDL